MSAAILQGVIVTTIDTDIWVDLPERQYIRLMNLVLQQGGTVKATIERQPVKVLPLERILKSKKTVLRDKDRLHILQIERVLKGRKRLKGLK